MYKIRVPTFWSLLTSFCTPYGHWNRVTHAYDQIVCFPGTFPWQTDNNILGLRWKELPNLILRERDVLILGGCQRWKPANVQHLNFQKICWYLEVEIPSSYHFSILIIETLFWLFWNSIWGCFPLVFLYKSIFWQRLCCKVNVVNKCFISHKLISKWYWVI